MPTSAASQDPTATVEQDTEFILDTDSHNLAMPTDLIPYMSERWGRYLESFGLRTAGELGIPRARWNACRADSWSPSGRPPGNDPEFFIEQLLDKYDINATILNNMVMSSQSMMGGNQPFAFTAAYMAAANDWAAQEWLAIDDRFYSGICAPFEDPPAGIAEIDRWGGNNRFVHIQVPFATQQPLGNPKYWDMHERAEHYGLPLAFHPGGSLHPLGGSGWPSFYFEDHAGRPQTLVAQIASLICEGVFDRFPRLKIVIEEGGWSWIRPYMWRLDAAWTQLREEVSHLERKPSEYVEDYFWFTSQPIEEPERRGEFEQSLEIFGSPDRLLYSSDYPHWDFDPPDRALPRTLSAELRAKILAGNAAEVYATLPRPGTA
jgi:predicted TIM-barrel fold metal-dependent hydrolase